MRLVARMIETTQLILYRPHFIILLLPLGKCWFLRGVLVVLIDQCEVPLMGVLSLMHAVFDSLIANDVLSSAAEVLSLLIAALAAKTITN